MSEEHDRLAEADQGKALWRKWGPYLSERQWGTVREDYSDLGDAWNYFTHDQSRSRAYRWGEDGIAGISDDRCRLCFAIALWNGVDPILKERLYGLPNSEGNHGEDVKEYYYYLDCTPTHSYMKYLYKYPQTAFPYPDLVQTNMRRSKFEQEYELIDTGVFDDDRYFDVFVEYAKETPEEILVEVTVCNRGPDPADLHLLPTLWFRNTWSTGGSDAPKPTISVASTAEVGEDGTTVLIAYGPGLGDRYLYCQSGGEPMFTDNETNSLRLFGTPNQTPWVKDAFDRRVVHGQLDAVNPALTGTKAAILYRQVVPAGGEVRVRLRLSDRAPAAVLCGAGSDAALGSGFDATFAAREAEADAFYRALLPASVDDEAAAIVRQSLAGMLWSKQYFGYDLHRWLMEHGVDPQRCSKSLVRNHDWFHMVNEDVISMPDKWEYPWFAAWDLAFHALPLSMVDPQFAKNQLLLMLSERYMHPNGQIPAYEWNFGDVNPPVHAWATLFLYRMDEVSRGGEGDIEFLKSSFQKLVMNFTWWVNRKDVEGNNVFGGGFLGLDNIGVFDRSSALPTGGYLEQSDGTSWMAFYAASMMAIAVELAMCDPVREDMALKFFEHFMWIASSMDRIGANRDELWDEDDGFFYDLLCLPNGQTTRLKVRSMVGLLPLNAAIVLPGDLYERLPGFAARAREFIDRHPWMLANIADPFRTGLDGRRLLSVVDEVKLRRILTRMLDPDEFLSPYGIRSLSRVHRDEPYVFSLGRDAFKVTYEPAESTTGMFGGNSNWRGPIWVPVNVLMIRALLIYYLYYGDSFRIECPTGSGQEMTLFEVARDIAHRLVGIFRRRADGTRPVFGSATKLQTDLHWRDHLLFYEYFHGDNGAGIGASHQTGWTGVVANLITLFATMDGPAFVAAEGLGTARPAGAPPPGDPAGGAAPRVEPGPRADRRSGEKAPA